VLFVHRMQTSCIRFILLFEYQISLMELILFFLTRRRRLRWYVFFFFIGAAQMRSHLSIFMVLVVAPFKCVCFQEYEKFINVMFV
jgi:hypothetical protein